MLRLMHESARKIQRTFRAVQMMRYMQTMAVEILVKAKLIREEYLTRHALVIQRSYRRWLQRRVPPIKPFRRAVMVLQSHQRRYNSAVQVAYFRKLVGTRLKRFARKVAVL